MTKPELIKKVEEHIQWLQQQFEVNKEMELRRTIAIEIGDMLKLLAELIEVR